MSGNPPGDNNENAANLGEEENDQNLNQRAREWASRDVSVAQIRREILRIRLGILQEQMAKWYSPPIGIHTFPCDHHEHLHELNDSRVSRESLNNSIRTILQMIVEEREPALAQAESHSQPEGEGEPENEEPEDDQ